SQSWSERAGGCPFPPEPTSLGTPLGGRWKFPSTRRCSRTSPKPPEENSTKLRIASLCAKVCRRFSIPWSVRSGWRVERPRTTASATIPFCSGLSLLRELNFCCETAGCGFRREPRASLAVLFLGVPGRLRTAELLAALSVDPAVGWLRA